MEVVIAKDEASHEEVDIQGQADYQVKVLQLSASWCDHIVS